MKTFIVNLPKDVDRRRHMEEQLKKAGIEDYEFVPGVVASELSEEELKERFDFERANKELRSCPTLPEIGCTLAHYNIWKKIAFLGKSSLVLEDDVQFLPSFKSLADSIINSLPKDESWVVVLSRNNILKRKVAYDFPVNLHKIFVCWGTYCYIMSPEAANKLCKTKPYTTADSWKLYSFQGINVYSCDKIPIEHNYDYKSNIGDNREIYQSLHVRIIERIGLKSIYKKFWFILHNSFITK